MNLEDSTTQYSKIGKILIIVVVAAILGVSAFMLAHKLATKDINDEFVKLEEVMKGSEIIKSDSFIIQVIPENNRINILDLHRNHGFVVADTNGIIPVDYINDEDYDLIKEMKKANISIENYPYKYIKGDIGIGINNTGDTIIFYRNKVAKASLQMSSYIHNVASTIQKLKEAKKDENNKVLLTTNLDIAVYSSITGRMTINDFEFNLPEQVVDSIVESNDIEAVITAMNFGASPDADKKPMYSVVLSDDVVLLVYSDKIIKMLNRSTNSYLYIKDGLKEDYQNNIKI